MALDATVGSDAEVSNEALLVMFANGDRDAARLTVRLFRLSVHAARLLGDWSRQRMSPKTAHAAVENCAGLASTKPGSQIFRDRRLCTDGRKRRGKRWMRARTRRWAPVSQAEMQTAAK